MLSLVAAVTLLRYLHVVKAARLLKTMSGWMICFEIVND